MPNYTIKLLAEEPGRADLHLLKELRKKFHTVSRGTIKVLFIEKRVHISGKPVAPSEDLIPGHYTIEVINWDPERDLFPHPSQAIEVSIPILFEDDDLLVIDKPSGMPSCPLRTNDTSSAVSAALGLLPKNEIDRFIDIGKISGHPLEAGLLHRLDTGTSGVLAFAKTLEEFQRIRLIWKSPAVKKFYRAIVSSEKRLPATPFSIETPLAHDAKSTKRMIAVDPEHPASRYRGAILPALTHVLSSRFTDLKVLELKLQIETGVMHQIRTHLASIGFSILGDPIYGEDNSSPKFTRLMLHHERLILPLKSGTSLTIESKPHWIKS